MASVAFYDKGQTVVLFTADDVETLENICDILYQVDRKSVKVDISQLPDTAFRLVFYNEAVGVPNAKTDRFKIVIDL